MYMWDPALRSIQRRQRIWSVLHHGRGRIGRTFNIGLSFLIVVSTAVVPLEHVESFAPYITTFRVIESIIVGIFTAEYVLRVYSAPRRLRYITSFWGIVDLLSIVPFYAGVFGSEYIRLLRLVRFFKLGEVKPSAKSDEGRSLKLGLGLLPNEEITYVATKHPLLLIVGCIPCVIALMGCISAFVISDSSPIGIAIGILLALFAVIFFWRAWLDYSYDVIYITNMRLIFNNQHLLGRSVNQVGYNSITNVKPQYAGILSYIFRFGTLVIDTAAEHPGQIGMTMVRKHERAAHAIMNQLHAHGRSVSMELNG